MSNTPTAAVPNESFVRIAPDSSGQRVRNVTMSVLQPDGTVVVVTMQVVSLMGIDGVPINLDDIIDRDYKLELLDEIRACRIGIQRLCENRGIRPDADDVAILDEAVAMRDDQIVPSQDIPTGRVT